MADRRIGGKSGIGGSADRRIAVFVGILLTAHGSRLTAQVWQPISMAGIQRVSGKVDSVFIDRQAPEFVVGGGDWVSYLAARLGAVPIPEPSGIKVSVDTARILVMGKLSDLPPETLSLLGPMATLVDPNTPLEAEVVMAPTGPGAVRFVLTTIRVGGFAIPESILARFLAQVGGRYPVLGKSGRELLVGVPADGHVSLVQDGVRIWVDKPGN
ncbi:MAG TPA: hypothetical protein VJU15_01955 [Gemmatimonadales bacterium]|nr:hypothetical protein [Gemmatimonadales bacterium]